jgi:hypothetical protein
MIDATRVRYDLTFQDATTGVAVHLATTLQGLSYEEPAGELSMRVQAIAANTTFGGRLLHEVVPLGTPLLLFADWGEGWKEIWRGTVSNWNKTDRGTDTLTLAGYDMLSYLIGSEDDRYYPAGTTGRTVIEDLANAWQMPLGTVEGPNLALAKMVFRGRALSDIIAEVLETTKKRGGGKWLFRAFGGKIDVVRAGQNPVVYHFGPETNLQQVQDQQDIEPGNFITRVRIVGATDGDDPRPVVETVDGHTEFGILQKIVNQEQYDTPAAARAAGEDLIRDQGEPRKRRSLVAPDLPFLRKGDRVHIVAGTLNGYCLVDGIQHDADNRTMTMEVSDFAG